MAKNDKRKKKKADQEDLDVFYVDDIEKNDFFNGGKDGDGTKKTVEPFTPPSRERMLAGTETAKSPETVLSVQNA